MIGRFTTTAFDSRADFEARRPSRVLVSYNEFTYVGLEWMWSQMAGLLRGDDGHLSDHLGAARLLVGDGSSDFSRDDTRLAGENTAQAELDAGYPTINRVDGAVEIAFRATFGERDGAFEWQERGVVTAQGVLLDRSVADQGRKVLGAVWQLDAVLSLE